MIICISTEQNTHFSVAIGQESIEKFEIVEKPYKQSELLLKTIEKLVQKQKIKLTDLSGIIVVSGPGQFSALRIGVVTANSLGFALDIPVVGVKLIKSWQDLQENEKLEKVWEKGVKLFKNKRKFNIRNQVVPEYGKEPNIT